MLKCLLITNIVLILVNSLIKNPTNIAQLNITKIKTPKGVFIIR
jgi:hypothetical protein